MTADLSRHESCLDDLCELVLRSDEPAERQDTRPVPPRRQRQKRLSEEQVNLLAQAYHKGASVPMLVERFGINRTTVLNHLERRGVPRRAAVRKLTDADVQAAARCYEAGESLKAVAALFGVSANTIRQELMRAEVEMRARVRRATS